MTPKRRYVARYLCSLDDPDATRTWFLFDRDVGAPVFDDRGVRLFTRQAVDAVLRSERTSPLNQGTTRSS